MVNAVRRIHENKITARSRRELFEFVKPIAAALQQTLGTKSEVVLHDFTDPEHSIIWIQGDVTGRQIGGSLSEIGLEMLRGGENESDRIGYVRNTKDGKVIKATTVLLKDTSRRVFGCLCVNVDITALLDGRDALDNFLIPPDDVRSIRFSNQVADVLWDMIEAAQRQIGRPAEVMNREMRYRFVAALEAKGAFAIQRSVPTVAKYLGVSRPTIYEYLEAIRREHGSPAPAGSSSDNDY